MPTINFRGQQVEATEVKFQTRKEDWNEYQLMDGSVLKMKLVVAEVYRIENVYDEENNPVYQVKSTNLLVVKSPDALKKNP